MVACERANASCEVWNNAGKFIALQSLGVCAGEYNKCVVGYTGAVCGLWGTAVDGKIGHTFLPPTPAAASPSLQNMNADQHGCSESK